MKMTENNKCINREKDGFCTKCQCYCPSQVIYDETNTNNVPCDLVSYVPHDLYLSCKYFDVRTKSCSKNLNADNCDKCIKFRTF